MMLKDDSPNAAFERSQSFTVGVGQPVALKPQSNAMTAAVCVGGLLVPGLGHLLLGRWVRGALLLVSVLLMFILGLGMHGALVAPPVPGDFVSFKTLNAFANAGTGLLYVIALKTGQEAGIPTAQTADYGWLFLVVAGLLNYLIVFDAFDIARGRKP
jgi:Family of unknown function (DUF6677)